jgi:hypothetical protein
VSVLFVVIEKSPSSQMGNPYYDMDFHPASLACPRFCTSPIESISRL